ncbi:MAG: hypothetical protein HYY00_01830 [Chloroflexi bacterium]|nr:hypothetical protein [Chloroflexota bacterium]
MRRLCMVGVAMVATLLVTTSVALGDWVWNAQLNVEGADVHTVWSVDDPDGANNYRANIQFSYPKGADVTLVGQLTDKEKVVLLATDKLVRTADGVQVQASYRVAALNGATGKTVTVTLVADGVALASAQGGLGQSIVVSGVVPAR